MKLEFGNGNTAVTVSFYKPSGEIVDVSENKATLNLSTPDLDVLFKALGYSALSIDLLWGNGESFTVLNCKRLSSKDGINTMLLES